MLKRFMCAMLILSILFTGSMMSVGAAETNQNTVLNDPISADGSPTIKSMEGASMIGWNGWDDWSNNTPSTYGRFMTATVEKAPEDADKDFTAANKVMNFTLSGIYNTTGRPSGAISCGSNLHVNKFLANPLSGKVRVKTKLNNASTSEGKNVAFNFVVGDAESASSEAMEKRLINAEIYGSTVEVKSNYGETGEAKTTISGVIPTNGWFELAIELDTAKKTWHLYVDGESVGNGSFVGDNKTVTLVAYSINRGGNTAFLESSDTNKKVSWYADDLEVQSYTDPGYKEGGMPTPGDAKWEKIAGEDFESATAKVDTDSLNSWGTKQWKIRSGVSGGYSNFQKVTIDAEDSSVDFANTNKVLGIELPVDKATQNIRPWWRIFKNGGNISGGLVKVSTRLNAKDAAAADLYLYAATESDWSYTGQIDPNSGDSNNGGYGLNKVRLYCDNDVCKVQLQPTYAETDSNYAAYMEGLYDKTDWFPVDMIYNLNTNKVTIYINNQKVAYRAKSGTGLTDVTEASFLTNQGDNFNWNIGNLVTMIQRDAGAGKWLVDDITVSVLSGYDTVMREDVTENLYETIAIPASWTSTASEAALMTANPANETDQVLYFKENTGAYGTFDGQNGVVTAQAEIYLPHHNTKMLPYKMYLADKDGNRLTEIRLDQYSVKNGFAESESPDRAGASQVEWEELAGTYNYPLGSWFTLKTVADMTNRTYDIYIDDTKINTSALDFYSTVAPTDDGLAAQIGFEALSGTMYVNNVLVTQASKTTNISIVKVMFTDAGGNESSIPSAGGKVSKITVNNTSTLDDDKTIFAAVYDADENLVNVTMTALSKDNGTGVRTINLEAADLTENWTDNWSARVFIFDNTTNIAPLAEAYTYGVSSLPTMYITGDSINTNYDASEYPRDGWGYELKSLLNSDKLRVVNRGASGNSSATFISNGRLRSIAERIKPGDYLLVSTVHNDCFGNTDEMAYKNNLQSYVDMAAAHGAKCIFVTSPYFRTKETNWQDSFTNHTNWFKEIAAVNNAPVIDLYTSWNTFKSGMNEERLKAYYNHTGYDGSYAADYRWSVSEYNPDSVNYDSTRTFDDDTHLSVRGAKLAAAFVADGIKNLDLPIAKSVKTSAVTYTADGDTLTIGGNGEIGEYAAFADAPWSDETGIKNVEIADGITYVGSNAFTGFDSLESITVPESVEYISGGALPSGNITMYGYSGTAAEKYAESKDNVTFYLKQLRILSIGNSHTSDYSRWRDLIFEDLKSAGMKTEIVFESIRNGGYQMYDTVYDDATYGGKKSHYVQGTNKVSTLYDEYATKLGDYNWDLVIIQDYRESALGKTTFTNGIAKTMRWLRDKQPNAKIAWVADWTDKGSLGAYEGTEGKYNTNDDATREKVKELFLNNSLSVIGKVESMTADKLDFIIPMGTALQNARTSYLATTLNAADCYNNTKNNDWAKGTIQNYSLLERDQTHCSYELGRYLVGTAVFAKVFDEYKDVLEGAKDLDYYDALHTAPVTTGDYEWKGDFNESIWNIVKESARNMMANPTKITDSVYTADPADAVADKVQNAIYTDFTQAGIAAALKALDSGIAVSESDITVSENSAIVTFLYGYTKKTVTITKN